MKNTKFSLLTLYSDTCAYKTLVMVSQSIIIEQLKVVKNKISVYAQKYCPKYNK